MRPNRAGAQAPELDCLFLEEFVALHELRAQRGGQVKGARKGRSAGLGGQQVDGQQLHHNARVAQLPGGDCGCEPGA